MKQLSALDALFLYAETSETPMHLSSVHPLELPKDYRGDFVADARAHVSKRLHLAPILHRKLLQMPYDLLTPMWMEDEDIDLEHHVRHIVLPKPGSMAQLSALVGRLQSTPLDRSRPLWELLLVEGFEGSGWAAIIKVHHSGIDGQSGQVLIEALMDLSPHPRKVTPPRKSALPGRRAGELGVGELLALGLKSVAARAAKLVVNTPQFLRSMASLGRVMGAALPKIPGGPARRDDGEAGSGVPRTRFNTSVTNQRVWAARSIPLDEVKRIARASDCTVNDVILALCGAALRKYLLAGHELPDRSLVALMPMSTRQPGDLEMSNRVSMAPVRLHTDDPDPLKQLQDIHTDTSSVKEAMSRARGGIPTDLPIIGMPWLMSGLVNLIGRLNLVDVLPLMGNLVITNVMTSPVPLYLCGARLRSYLPVLILMHGQALGLAIHTYAGSVDFGIVGCRRAMPDVEEIGELIVEAVSELGRAVPERGAGRPGDDAGRPNPAPARKAIRAKTRVPAAREVKARPKATPRRPRKAITG